MELNQAEQTKQPLPPMGADKKKVIWSVAVAGVTLATAIFLYSTGAFDRTESNKGGFSGRDLEITCEDFDTLSTQERADRNVLLSEVFKMDNLTYQKLDTILPENCYVGPKAPDVFSGQDVEIDCEGFENLSLREQENHNRRTEEIFKMDQLTRPRLEVLLPQGCRFSDYYAN